MIHDELVIELQQDKLAQVTGRGRSSSGHCMCAPGCALRVVRPLPALQVAALVRECMEVTAPQRLGLTVPLPVALSCGPTWGDLEDFDAHAVPQPADRVE